MIYSITPKYVDFIPELIDMKDGILYISEKYKTAIHLCACGCRNQTVTPLSQGWTLTKSDGKITLLPSIGNFQFKCRSHYYITNNLIQWL